MTAVAAKRLAHPASETAAFIGCGVQARSPCAAAAPGAAGIAARRGARPQRRRAATPLCGELRDAGWEVRIAAGPDDVLAGADVAVSTVPEHPGWARLSRPRAAAAARLCRRASISAGRGCRRAMANSRGRDRRHRAKPRPRRRGPAQGAAGFRRRPRRPGERHLRGGRRGPHVLRLLRVMCSATSRSPPRSIGALSSTELGRDCHGRREAPKFTTEARRAPSEGAIEPCLRVSVVIDRPLRGAGSPSPRPSPRLRGRSLAPVDARGYASLPGSATAADHGDITSEMP